MAECVEHYFEGRNAWGLGILGFFTRLRGIVFTIILALLTMGTPFWWPDNFLAFNIPFKYTIIVFFGFMVISVVAAFCYLRMRSRRSLDIKHYLHALSHFLRDYQTKTYRRTSSKDIASGSDEVDRLRSYADQICERLKDFFSRLTRDSTIEAAIRIATYGSDVAGKRTVLYSTVGRSSGLSSQRQESTELISADEGIARFFIEEKDSRGVLIYNNMRKAADMGAYKWTVNDEKYPDEIRTMMVAPLNAWDGNQQSMIGILYITSRAKKLFSIKYVDSMRFAADTIAKAMACYVTQRNLLETV